MLTPTESWPGLSSGCKSLALAVSIRATRREVEKTAGKASEGSLEMALARSAVETVRVLVAVVPGSSFASAMMR